MRANLFPARFLCPDGVLLGLRDYSSGSGLKGRNTVAEGIALDYRSKTSFAL